MYLKPYRKYDNIKATGYIFYNGKNLKIDNARPTGKSCTGLSQYFEFNAGVFTFKAVLLEWQYFRFISVNGKRLSHNLKSNIRFSPFQDPDDDEDYLLDPYKTKGD